MRLSDALLVTMYLLGGKTTTQFTWNLQLCLIYMWCSDTIPIRPLKFVCTNYGPWNYRSKKEILHLFDKEYISDSYSDIEYIAEIDSMINDTFFDETISYRLTELGEKQVKKLCKVYKIDLTKVDISSMFYTIEEADIPTLVSVIREHFPEMVKRRKK